MGGRALLAATIGVLALGCAHTTDGSARVASGVIPDVLGMAAHTAHHALFVAGPWPYVERSEWSSTVASGLVLTVGPAPGTVWPLNKVIDFVVSRGPA